MKKPKWNELKNAQIYTEELRHYNTLIENGILIRNQREITRKIIIDFFRSGLYTPQKYIERMFDCNLLLERLSFKEITKEQWMKKK